MSEEEIVEEEVGEVIDLDEIAKKYEVKGFFKRLSDMFKGLGQPHDTREYKLARIELQRLAAPLTAIVVPIVFGIVLCVVTMISGQKKDIIIADIAQIEDEPEELREEEEIPPDDIEPPPMEEVEITVDPPNPTPAGTSAGGMASVSIAGAYPKLIAAIAPHDIGPSMRAGNAAVL